MDLRLHRLQLKLAHPFTISRGTMTQQHSLVVQLSADGLSGWGEVTENSYYHRTLDGLTESIHRARPILDSYRSQPPNEVWPELMERLEGDTFAASALDMAAHDWWAKRQSLPTWKAWGLQWNTVVRSSYTIAIDTTERMKEKLNEHPDWPIYKIKLGTKQDLEIVRALRSCTQATLRVDANCGWSVTQTIEMSAALAELGVEFIEQPLPANASWHDHRQVFQSSRLPIIADESCQTIQDVERCHEHFHGINVKICKCGGLTPALQMLSKARQLGMKTMVGCMIESSIGISGAAQLLPLLDFADLDGACLLASDPTKGIQVANGLIQRPSIPGNGGCLPEGGLLESK